jgi:hypothetical protein
LAGAPRAGRGYTARSNGLPSSRGRLLPNHSPHPMPVPPERAGEGGRAERAPTPSPRCSSLRLRRRIGRRGGGRASSFCSFSTAQPVTPAGTRRRSPNPRPNAPVVESHTCESSSPSPLASGYSESRTPPARRRAARRRGRLHSPMTRKRDLTSSSLLSLGHRMPSFLGPARHPPSAAQAIAALSPVLRYRTQSGSCRVPMAAERGTGPNTSYGGASYCRRGRTPGRPRVAPAARAARSDPGAP